MESIGYFKDSVFDAYDVQVVSESIHLLVLTSYHRETGAIDASDLAASTSRGYNASLYVLGGSHCCEHAMGLHFALQLHNLRTFSDEAKHVAA